MRIAYCIEGFYNHGGMERVISVKANWLAEHGHKVTIVVAIQKGLPAAFTITPSIKLIDLNCNSENLKRSYKEALTQHLYHNVYDITISTGGIESFFLYKIKDESHKLVEFHFAWNRFFVISGNPISKIKALFQTTRQIRCATKYERAVLLTHTDEQFYKQFLRNTYVIPNPITIEAKAISECKSKNAIAFGRLDYQKGFDLLIRSWSIVAQRHPDWRLNIFGDGKEHTQLIRIIEQFGLEGFVSLNGHASNIGHELVNSSINICPSRSEGFSLSILEAARYGVPSIAFNCVAGPSEIISTGLSGIIVKPVGDIDKLAKAICELIDNDSLRKSMSAESYKISQSFCIKVIMPKWEHLFSTIVSQTNRLSNSRPTQK